MTRSYNADRIRRRLSLFTIDTLFRLIHECHAGTPLGVAVAPSRFSDPKGKYAVLYAAGTVPCALWEGLVRNRLARRQRREIPKQEVKETRVVSLTASEPLALVDLRDDGPVRIGAPTAVAHDSNHAAGRALKEGAYVFAGKTPDQPIGSFRKAWATAVRRANITRRGSLVHLPIKCLRKAHATWQAERGINESVLQGLLGHARGSRVTKRYYVHATEEAKRAAVIVLPFGASNKQKSA